MKQVVSKPVALFCAAVLLGFAVPVNAQKSGSTGGAGAASSGSGLGTSSASATRGTTSNLPTSTTTNSNTGGFDQSRPIFLSGSVMFDDGSPANSDIRIERVCAGSTHLETHTDSKGRFSFQLGGELSAGIADADSSNQGFGNVGRSASGMPQSQSSNGGFGGSSTQAWMGCELRAAYPGYVSEEVDLSTRHSMDDPKVGTILLHHLGNVKGTTISLTTSQAPKAAQKNYEKGMLLAQKGKFEEAAERLENATTAYPKFAVAWFALGQVQQRLNKPEEAKKFFLSAAAADSHYVSPYDQLALVSAQQGKWEDAAKYSKEATDLNPVEFPTSFWYNALANYNLKNDAEAEKSLRALLKLDSRHKYPQAETMMAELAANRGDLDDAAAHLKAYLAEVPNAPDASAVKGQLARVEQARATQAKNAPAPVSQ